MPEASFDASQPTAVHTRSLAAAFLRISRREVDFDRRGFKAEPSVRKRLERNGMAFVDGYNAALSTPAADPLADLLETFELDLIGFAHEGASMALALLDLLAPWRRSRWRAFVERAGDRHIYLCLVGAGWALPRLFRRRLPRFVDRTLLWPLVYDGFGFHQGFFHARKAVARRVVPRLSGYERRAFDQGLGRSLWFTCGANPDRIVASILAFDRARQSDLWSGVGLAAAYAGGTGQGEIRRLVALAGEHREHLAQGVVFAAAARALARNVTPDCELAGQIVCGMTAGAAADLASAELHTTSPAGARSGEAYEAWRRRIQARFRAER